MFLITLQASALEIPFDDLTALQGILPKKTKHYEIVDPVVLEGNNYTFKIKSPHGEYQVTSITKLLKTCHEIRVIEEYQHTEEGEQVWQGTKEGFKEMGQGAKAVIINPRKSGKAIGASLAKTGRKIGRFFKKKLGKKKEEPVGEGEDRSIAAGGGFGKKAGREFAYNMQLDVYSDNPYVRALIQELAQANAKGSAIVGVTSFLLSPIPGLRTITRGALTPGASEDKTERALRDNDAAEINYQLRKVYADAHGWNHKKDVAKLKHLQQFLDNPNYSPREKAYIVLYLQHLEKAEGIARIYTHLGQSTTIAQAITQFHQLELLHGYHQSISPIQELVPLAYGVAGITEKGILLAVSPMDHAIATDRLLAVRDELVKAAKKANSKETVLWVVGQVDSNFVKSSAAQGLKVKGELLKVAAFSK